MKFREFLKNFSSTFAEIIGNFCLNETYKELRNDSDNI